MIIITHINVINKAIFVFIIKFKAKTIQKAIKEFLQKKHENLDLVTPSNFKCPITLELFEHPVVASDGNTYEYDSILRIINTTRQSPLTGQRLDSKTLVPNLNLRSEVMEFRQHHKLKIPANFYIVNSAPTLSSAPWTPTRSLHSIPDRTTFDELFKIDGFLNEIRKPGLCLLAQMVNPDIWTISVENSKPNLIHRIMNRDPDINDTGFKEIVTKLLDVENGILPHMLNAALDRLLRSMGVENKGNQMHKIKSVKYNLPITLNINLDGDQYPLTVTRKMTTEQVFGMVNFKKYIIKHDDYVYIARICIDTGTHQKLSDYDMKHCDIITMTPRLPAAVQLPMYDRSSGGIQVFVRPAWSSISMQLIVQNYTTIATFKQMIFAHAMVTSHFMQDETLRLENLKLVFRGRQLENLDETLESYLHPDPDHDVGVGRMVGMQVNDITFQLQFTNQGGMPKKGIKKISKDEKVFTLRSRVEYITRDASSDVMNIVMGITRQENFIQNTIENMTSVDDTKALHEALLSVNRNEKIAELITPFLIPQIRIMRQEIETREQAIEQVEATIEHAYAKEFYGASGYTMSDLSYMVEEHLNTLQEQQRVQRGVEAALAGTRSAMMTDA